MITNQAPDFLHETDEAGAQGAGRDDRAVQCLGVFWRDGKLQSHQPQDHYSREISLIETTILARLQILQTNGVTVAPKSLQTLSEWPHTARDLAEETGFRARNKGSNR
jgi:hypothetical protein